MKLILAFDYCPHPELVEIVFINSSGQEKISYRGKYSLSGNKAGSFQWTAAVKAFALLVLGTQIALLQKKKSLFILKGEAKSLAVSLDYAISKPTEWITDLWGKDSKDRASVNKIFRRENSGRKLPGPVKISLAPIFLESGSLKILIAEHIINDIEELQSIYNLIDNDTAQDRISDARDWHRMPWFKSALKQELTFALSETELLQALSNRKSKLIQLLPAGKLLEYKNIIKKVCLKLNKLQNLPSKVDTSSIAELQKLNRPIKVSATPMAIGAICIFYYLRDQLKVPIEIDITSPSSFTLMRNFNRETCDLALLSWNAVLSNKNHIFQPLMLMPRTSFDLLCSDEDLKGSKSRQLMLATDKMGYPNLYFQNLCINKILQKTDLKITHASLAEISSQISGGKRNTLAILGFPFSIILQKKYKLKIYKKANEYSRIGDNLLMLNNKLKIIGNLELQQLLRSIWHTLLEDPKLQEQLIVSLLNDKNYLSSLKRIGDLHKN